MNKAYTFILGAFFTFIFSTVLYKFQAKSPEKTSQKEPTSQTTNTGSKANGTREVASQTVQIDDGLADRQNELNKIEKKLSALEDEKNTLNEKRNVVQEEISRRIAIREVIENPEKLPPAGPARDLLSKVALAVVALGKDQNGDSFAKIRAEKSDIVLKIDALKLFRQQENPSSMKTSQAQKLSLLIKELKNDVKLEKVSIYQNGETSENLARQRLLNLENYLLTEGKGEISQVDLKTEHGSSEHPEFSLELVGGPKT